VFRWDSVRLNFPAGEGYYPLLPWVSKVSATDGLVVADRVIFVGDARLVGNREKECWAATQKKRALSAT
jgi:predicted O-methyltransferase YrrM